MKTQKPVLVILQLVLATVGVIVRPLCLWDYRRISYKRDFVTVNLLGLNQVSMISAQFEYRMNRNENELERFSDL